MAEIYTPQVFPGTVEDISTLAIPKVSLVADDATYPLVPAATNSLESIVAAMTQKFAEVFTQEEQDADSERNLVVSIADGTLTTDFNDGTTYVVIQATYTFRYPAPPELLAALKLNPTKV